MAKVFVGLSGGVDSSVAAWRLQRQGHEVVGVFIKVWQPDFISCNWEQERLDAMRVAAFLNIPFLTCDAEEAYKRHVGEYFIKEYQAGRTPNPDVMCNRYVKFGAFWEFAKAHGADFIATGHYARIEKRGDTYDLLRGVDPHKDQSYFLWTLTQDDLAHTLFPVGDTIKSDLRLEAERIGLPTAIKKDSQGICFLGHVDIPSFLSHFIKLTPGTVFDVHGQRVGTHDGALIYTLGQRHGFTIEGVEAQTPYYVVSKEITSNALIVDHQPPSLVRSSEIELADINWIKQAVPQGNIEAVFRYRQTPQAVTLTGATSQTMRLETEADKPAAGQSVVFYQGPVCLGGAVIQ